MPIIRVEGGQLSSTQKQQLIKKLTDVAAAEMNIPKEFITVMISEFEDENMGMAGKTVAQLKVERK